MAFQEEAQSEALKALWKCAVKFNPRKQTFQRRGESHEDATWAYLLGCPLPETPQEDPFTHFWIWSLTYIRGSVLDFFRSQKLITKVAKGETASSTMLVYDRFVSLSRPLSEVAAGVQVGGSVYETLGDTIPSVERADARDTLTDNRKILSGLRRAAHLTKQESQVLYLCYNEHGYTKSDVAKLMHMSAAWVQKQEENALLKLRGVVSD